MLIGKPPDIPSSEITPLKDYRTYLDRRRFLKRAAAVGAAALAADRIGSLIAPGAAFADTKLQTVPSPLTTTGEQLTSFQDITHYNNYYEFGVDKTDPARNAGALPTRPWKVKVEGKVNKPQIFDIDQLLKLRPLEDRVYRHRCVEAWSMVIPWVGYSLSELIKLCDPQPSAKFVQFESYFNWGVESGQRVADRLALCRRPAHRRSHEPAHAVHLRPVRRSASQPGWRSGANRGSVEVRFQIGKIDSENQVC